MLTLGLLIALGLSLTRLTLVFSVLIGIAMLSETSATRDIVERGGHLLTTLLKPALDHQSEKDQ